MEEHTGGRGLDLLGGLSPSGGSDSERGAERAEEDRHLRKWKVNRTELCHEIWSEASRLGCVIFL